MKGRHTPEQIVAKLRRGVGSIPDRQGRRQAGGRPIMRRQALT